MHDCVHQGVTDAQSSKHIHADNLDNNAYVPPASSSTPLAGVTTALYCLNARMFFMAPVKVAATRRGATYLHGQHTHVAACFQ